MQTKRVRFENEESQLQDMILRAVDAMKSGVTTPPKSTRSAAQAVAQAVVASDDDDILPSGIGPSSSSSCRSSPPASRRARGTAMRRKCRMSDGLSSSSDKESAEDSDTSDGHDAGKYASVAVVLFFDS